MLIWCHLVNLEGLGSSCVAIGSGCFLFSGVFSYLEFRTYKLQHKVEWSINALWPQAHWMAERWSIWKTEEWHSCPERHKLNKCQQRYTEGDHSTTNHRPTRKDWAEAQRKGNLIQGTPGPAESSQHCNVSGGEHGTERCVVYWATEQIVVNSQTAQEGQITRQAS